MSHSPEDIADTQTRIRVLELEDRLNAHRQGVAKLGELLTSAAQLFGEPVAVEYMKNSGSNLVQAARRALEELRGQRAWDAAMRIHGFDARRAGRPVTENPHLTYEIVEGARVLITSRKALNWYVGWKQGARSGESLFGS